MGFGRFGILEGQLGVSVMNFDRNYGLFVILIGVAMIIGNQAGLFSFAEARGMVVEYTIKQVAFTNDSVTYQVDVTSPLKIINEYHPTSFGLRVDRYGPVTQCLSPLVSVCSVPSVEAYLDGARLDNSPYAIFEGDKDANLVKAYSFKPSNFVCTEKTTSGALVKNCSVPSFNVTVTNIASLGKTVSCSNPTESFDSRGDCAVIYSTAPDNRISFTAYSVEKTTVWGGSADDYQVNYTERSVCTGRGENRTCTEAIVHAGQEFFLPNVTAAVFLVDNSSVNETENETVNETVTDDHLMWYDDLLNTVDLSSATDTVHLSADDLTGAYWYTLAGVALIVIGIGVFIVGKK